MPDFSKSSEVVPELLPVPNKVTFIDSDEYEVLYEPDLGLDGCVHKVRVRFEQLFRSREDHSKFAPVNSIL